MTLHIISACVAVAAALLYADRSAVLYVQGSQRTWAMVTRASVVLLLAAVAVAYIDLARSDEAFLWRHILVLAALSGVVGGHLGMRWTQSPPT